MSVIWPFPGAGVQSCRHVPKLESLDCDAEVYSEIQHFDYDSADIVAGRVVEIELCIFSHPFLASPVKADAAAIADPPEILCCRTLSLHTPPAVLRSVIALLSN